MLRAYACARGASASLASLAWPRANARERVARPKGVGSVGRASASAHRSLPWSGAKCVAFGIFVCPSVGFDISVAWAGSQLLAGIHDPHRRAAQALAWSVVSTASASHATCFRSGAHRVLYGIGLGRRASLGTRSARQTTMSYNTRCAPTLRMCRACHSPC